MNSPFDDLVNRVTERFDVDPELRAEIGHELRTHLDDSAAESRAAGMSDDDAIAAAAKALGDEGEIAEKLWQANRRRVRIRKAARVAFGIGAGPVAAVAVFAVGWSSLVSICVVFAAFSMGHGQGMADYFYRRAHADLVASLPPASRQIFDVPDDPDAAVTWAATLAAQHPADPVFAANCASRMLLGCGIPDHTPEMLAACRRGSEIEPENGYFHLMSAVILFDGAATIVPPPAIPDRADSFDFNTPDLPYPAEHHHFFAVLPYQVLDPARLSQGLAEFHLAAQCAYIDSHAFDMLQKRLDVLPPATHLSDHLLQQMTAYQVLLPSLNMQRNAVDIACSAAFDAAEQNHRDQALGLVTDARRVGELGIPRARGIVELLVAIGMRDLAVGTEAVIDRRLGMTAQADAARTRYINWQVERWSMRGQTDPARVREIKLTADSVTAQFIPSQIKVSDARLSPGRTAEYAVSDRAMLAVVTLILLLIAAGMSLPALLPKHRRILFMGWRRLGLATLVTISPVAIYAAYTMIAPLSGRDYAMHISYDRLLVEYAAVAVAVRLLISAAAARAVQARALDVETDLPIARPSRWNPIIDLSVGLVLIAYIAVWHFLAARMNVSDMLPTQGLGLFIIPLLIMYGLADRNDLRWYGLLLAILLGVAASGTYVFGLRKDSLPPVFAITLVSVIGGMIGLAIYRFARDRRRNAGSAFSLRLSEAPLFVSTALALLCLFGPLLWLQERYAVSEMSQPGGSYSFQHELELSPWKELQKSAAEEAG